MKIIKNGFTNSTGWNLGRKYRSIHLLEPLISTPKIGTNTNKINESKNIRYENWKSFFWSIEEKIKIVIIPRKTNIKCLKKKE